MKSRIRRFPHVEDIPNLGKQGIDINKVDSQMLEVVRNVRYAIGQDREMRKKVRELNSMLGDLLRQSMFTHQSIRILMKHAYKNADYPIIADTASLVREQLEKIFIIVAVLEDPKKWLKQYQRNAWQKDYERYLLELDEHEYNERHSEFLKEQFPGFLEKQRKPPHRYRKYGHTILVSKFARRCVRYNWYNPDAPKPEWFKRPKGNLRGFLSGYFYFPSPWDAVRLVKEQPDYHMFLDRWYREYKYYSAYSHVLMDKLVLQHFSQFKSVAATEKLEIYGQRKAEQFILTTGTATATLCTLIMPHLSNHYGSKQQLIEFWEKLAGFGLLPKALWNLYPKNLLTK